jgi:hypothetical protein
MFDDSFQPVFLLHQSDCPYYFSPFSLSSYDAINLLPKFNQESSKFSDQRKVCTCDRDKLKMARILQKKIENEMEGEHTELPLICKVYDFNPDYPNVRD